MSLPDGSATASATWSVAELHEALGLLIEQVFGDQLWVQGEIANLKRVRGHVYFDLVEPDRDDPGGPSLNVALFDQERREVNRFLREQGDPIRMRDGVRIRIRGRLGTYPARSSVQLVMSWIDPSHTLGVLGQQRDRVLAALAAEGLLERNGSLPMPDVPLRVALVTSIGSAAHADALDELRRCGIGFRVTVLHTLTQGAGAPGAIVAALEAACAGDHDVVLLVRGGGARTDLAAFDDESVCRAIAAATLPVLTGIGHEVDRTAADDVAHAAHKTPTAAAAAVVATVEGARGRVRDLAAQLRAAARGRTARAEAGLEQLSARAGRAAASGVARSSDRVEHLRARLAAAPARNLASLRTVLSDRAAATGTGARRALRDVDRQLDMLAARARSHDPGSALARGWSITRLADGTIVRHPDQVAPGERLVTTVAGGTVTSVADDPPGDPSDGEDTA